MGNELYIDGNKADLSGDAPIAITVQVNNLADLKDRQSTFSNSIKLPLTSNNKQILGQAQADAFTQQQPYQKLPCKLVQNGIEVIINGTISLLSVSDNFECQITYGLSGINDALKKKTIVGGLIVDIQDAKLVDLDWSDIPNFMFDLPTVVASQNYEGVLWPVIDYGDTLDNTSTINITYLRPGVYYTQIFDRIEKYTGYKFSGGASWAAGFNDFIPFSDNKLYDYLGEQWTNPSQPLSVAKNLPDFTLKNVLKDYMQRYFLTPIVDNYKKTVVFRSFDELYLNKANAKDWTKKFVNEARSDSFEVGNYAQVNRMTFTEDSQDADYNGEFYGQVADGTGVFYVANENLDSDVELVKSIFAASGNVTKLGTRTVAQIKKFDESPLPNYGSDFVNETKPRVINIQNALFGPFVFDYTTGSQINTLAQTGIFRSYTDYINNYGTGFLRLLNKARSVERYALLTELDIKDFDFFTPIYDEIEGQHYYVSQIVNFIPGKKTKVNLIRM